MEDVIDMVYEEELIGVIQDPTSVNEKIRKWAVALQSFMQIFKKGKIVDRERLEKAAYAASEELEKAMLEDNDLRNPKAPQQLGSAFKILVETAGQFALALNEVSPKLRFQYDGITNPKKAPAAEAEFIVKSGIRKVKERIFKDMKVSKNFETSFFLFREGFEQAAKLMNLSKKVVQYFFLIYATIVGAVTNYYRLGAPSLQARRRFENQRDLYIVLLQRQLWEDAPEPDGVKDDREEAIPQLQ